MEFKLPRRNDIDWLRNLGILLLIPFHTAHVFTYWGINYIKDVELSWILTWFISLTAFWFMPLLFFLAGASSFYSLIKRTGKEYLKERFYKLFIPFLFCVPLIIPPQAYIAKITNKGFEGSYIDFLKGYFTDFSDLTGYYGSFTPAHLWFILYLFIFSLCAVQLFIKFKNTRLKILNSPVVLILFFIPMTISEVLPAPGGKNPLYFFLIFLAGYFLCKDETTQSAINKMRFKCLVILIPVVSLFLTFRYLNRGADPYSTSSIALAFLRNFSVWITLIVILGYGNKFLSKTNKFLQYMNKIGFPLYILHQTILIVIAYFIIKLQINIFIKFILINLLTFLICILLIEIFKKFFITRWIIGIKKTKEENNI